MSRKVKVFLKSGDVITLINSKLTAKDFIEKLKQYGLIIFDLKCSTVIVRSEEVIGVIINNERKGS